MKEIVVFMIILSLFSGCEKAKERPKQTHPATHPQASVSKSTLPPIFTFQDTNGTKVQMRLSEDALEISDHPKVAILLFLTSWCPSCKAQIPELKEIKKQFGQKVHIYAFLLDRPQDPKAFKTQEGIDFFLSTSYKENERFAKLAYERVHAPADMPIPLMIVLKDGKYFIHYIGATPLEILQIDIKKALGE